MKAATLKMLTLEREGLSEADRALFTKDFCLLADEYFERIGEIELDVTRTDEGFSVCIVFATRRIKKVKAVR